MEGNRIDLNQCYGKDTACLHDVSSASEDFDVVHPTTQSETDRTTAIAAGGFWRSQHGLSLVELIVTVAILAILATVVYPIARFEVQRRKEQVLRDDLWKMRHAIDEYKDAADRGGIRVSIDSFGYPPDLETLVNGVEIKEHKVRFLREIPTDPMTGRKDWVLRSMQDDPDSGSWGGQNVFDVHSNSQGTALNGTKYSTW